MMSAIWVVAHVVTQILSELTVEIEHLLTESNDAVNIFRVRDKAEALLGTPAQLKDISEYITRVWHSVDKINIVREDSE